MRLIFEDAFDHYLEDPDNEERIKKAEQDAIKLADKPLPKVKAPKYKWMLYPKYSNNPVYLLHPFDHTSLIYTKNRDEASLMTADHMKIALSRYEKKFGTGYDGPYNIT